MTTFASRPTLGHVIDALGGIALEVIELPRGRAVRIDEVVLYDTAADLAVDAGALLLGVGVAGERGLIDLLDRLGRAGAAGLVIKSPEPLTPAVLAAVQGTGVAMLVLNPAASWFQVTVLLRSAMDEMSAMNLGDISGVPVGDLFSLANAIADLIDAPVTIEDRASRVLAFSRRQEEADQGRVATILGQQVPEHYVGRLKDLDVFGRLSRESEPVFVEGLEDGMLPRLAVAVRSGPELLGTIWAAVSERPPPETIEAFLGAARLAGLHLLRHRGEADLSRRFHSEQLAAVLEGGAGAAEAAQRLGMPRQPLIVFAAEPTGREGGEFEAAQRKLVDTLGVNLAVVHSKTATARVGGTVYAVVPTPGPHDEGAARGLSVARRFLGRIGSRDQVVIGVGGPSQGIGDLAGARREADRALQVLRRRGESHGAVHYDDVYLESLLIRLVDTAVDEGDGLRGPLRRVRRHDQEQGKDYIATLSCYLDAGGDVRAAATTLNLHANTVRYRLRRIEELSGLDLADPMTRLSALIQLRAAALEK
ncbi:MAG TPA: helix-turn-helix domain-containing protein [Actinomadura sp.]|nr:helix-turn-helix domain-containing protein [Actinomadura sp.]